MLTLHATSDEEGTQIPATAHCAHIHSHYNYSMHKLFVGREQVHLIQIHHHVQASSW